MITPAVIPISIRRNDTSQHRFTLTNISDDGTRKPIDVSQWDLLGQAKHDESNLFFEFPITKIDAANGVIGFSITKAIGETLLPIGSEDSISVPYEIQATTDNGELYEQTGTLISGTFEVVADLVEEGRLKNAKNVGGFKFSSTSSKKTKL
ncbi:MAG: hypothetical protein COA84_14025 [Robiginitomaculum sp.]|nr:MAG: hypothetical protein COA84_14025 [Robiginitomaculum sp.]